MSKEALKLALEALKNSVDSVSNEAREAESLYGNYPSRLARVQGLVALEVAHQKAIKALEEALKQEECDCKDQSQCWEPCGQLGKSEEHAKVYEQEQDAPVWSLEDCVRTLKTLNYIEGIAVKGEGRQMRDDESLEQFILGYVKRLEAKLAKQEQGEPVGEVIDAIDGAFKCVFSKMLPIGTKLYTTPQQRTWVELTEDEKDAEAAKEEQGYGFVQGALWAEAKLKEKNNG